MVKVGEKQKNEKEQKEGKIYTFWWNRWGICNMHHSLRGDGSINHQYPFHAPRFTTASVLTMYLSTSNTDINVKNDTWTWLELERALWDSPFPWLEMDWCMVFPRCPTLEDCHPNLVQKTYHSKSPISASVGLLKGTTEIIRYKHTDLHIRTHRPTHTYTQTYTYIHTCMQASTHMTWQYKTHEKLLHWYQ